jgi:uncharacterized FlaG/YvyC family protein
MAEEAMDASGTYATIGSADFTTSYQGPTPVARQTVSAPTMPSSGAPVQPSTPTTPSSAATVQPSAASSVSAGTQPSARDIQAMVARANANLASSNRVLDFRVDAATGLSIAMIRDAQTGAVVQQIPGADVIALAQMLADWSPGKHVVLDLIA